MNKRFSWLQSPKSLLALLLIAALAVRLYRIGNPVADWHAFRQADTASVTREYVKHGVDLLRPHYHDLSNIQSGKDNLEGYRMVEFPFVNGALAVTLRALPFLPLVLTSRLASVVISLGTLLFLIGFTEKITGNKTAAKLAGFFFAFLPFSIYYSRVILPEPFLLFFSTGSLYFLTTAFGHKKPFRHWSFWLSAVFLSLALLLKPFAAFLAPVYGALIWQQKPRIRLSLWWIIYAVIAILPLWWWRSWIQQFPTGIAVSDWLLNGNGIRFRPAWFRWIFYERFTKLILGFTGVFLAASALLWQKKEQAVLWAWWLGLLVYASVIATGSVQHDYYQVLFIPLICFTLALGTLALWQRRVDSLARIGIIVLVVLSLGLSWKQVAGYFNVNHWEYVEAGEAVDRLTSADAKVIAPAFGDTQFLFQTNRTGWPIGFEIEDKISKGATHYVTTSYDDEARELESRYKTMAKTDRYLILDLTQQIQGDPQ